MDIVGVGDAVSAGVDLDAVGRDASVAVDCGAVVSGMALAG